MVGVFGGESIAPRRAIKSWKFKPLLMGEEKKKKEGNYYYYFCQKIYLYKGYYDDGEENYRT
jgi:hypothetical protein